MGARIYDPAGALAVGFLDEVVPEGELVDRAMAEARRLAELRTGAYARTKANARAAFIAEVDAGIETDMTSIDAPSA
jgi:enoyl-CoA hydratase